MKKLILVSGILFIFANQILPQLLGSGTVADPYYGSVSANTDWYPDGYPNGRIYVLDLTINSGATLSVRPGLYYGGIVQFTAGHILTIGTGCTFIIYPGTGVTADEINNSGTLILGSSSNEPAAASLIHDAYEDNGVGVTEVRHFISGGQTPGGSYKWHYIASPIPNVGVNAYNTQNLAQYVESLVTGEDNYPGWVAYDGYQYSSGTTLGNTFITLTVGKGYNYYSSTDATVVYSGSINYGNKNVLVTAGTSYPDYQGYNLIGNPFAACIDWDYIIDQYTPAFVNDAIYFTLNGSIASYVGGIGDNGGTGTIPPLQGFFVKANANSTVALRASARIHNIDQLRYKKKSTANDNPATDTISFIRLKMLGSNDSTDLVIRFNSKATSYYDTRFDAYEFSRTSGDINLWTTTAGTDYSINGLPFPENEIEIPVGINLKLNGTFRLFSSEMNKVDNYSVLLKDVLTNKMVDLKKGEYAELSATPGSITDRYVIVINKSATSVTDLINYNGQFAIYPSSGKIINVRAMSDILRDSYGSLVVYDLGGRKIYQQDHVEWSGPNDIKQIHLDSRISGVVLVEVRAGVLKYTEKVLVQ